MVGSVEDPWRKMVTGGRGGGRLGMIVGAAL